MEIIEIEEEDTSIKTATQPLKIIEKEEEDTSIKTATQPLKIIEKKEEDTSIKTATQPLEFVYSMENDRSRTETRIAVIYNSNAGDMLTTASFLFRIRLKHESVKLLFGYKTHSSTKELPVVEVPFSVSFFHLLNPTLCKTEISKMTQALEKETLLEPRVCKQLEAELPSFSHKAALGVSLKINEITMMVDMEVVTVVPHYYGLHLGVKKLVSCFTNTTSMEESLLESKRFNGEVDDLWGLEKTKCSICSNEFVVGKYVTKTPCNHYFHKDCISKLLTKKVRICPSPLCKVQLPKFRPYS